MTKVILNGKRMITKEKTHAYLKRKFEFPDYYGKNLDALWDLLSVWDKELEIVIINQEDLIENLDDYGNSLLKLFSELDDENRNITVRFEN
ncbi:MAG: barstar family protein [Clostridiaceae bacterium]